jgi:hypothetical protein
MYDKELQTEIYSYENIQLNLHVSSRQSSRCESRGRRGREERTLDVVDENKINNNNNIKGYNILSRI